MKTNSFYGMMMLAAAAQLLAGCQADGVDESKGQVPITLTATVIESQDPMDTRAGTSLLNSFSNGDVLGINLTNCVSSSGTTLSTSTYTVGTGFTTQPYIKAGQTATVKGYYPSSAASATSFTVQSDQTSDTNYKTSDLMFASSQNATKASPSPTLTFAHKMAKIIVNVTATSGVTGITSVTLKNISRTIGWTASSGALGTLSNSGDITMSNNGAALIPPQTVTDKDFLQISTNMGDVTYKLNSKTFASGGIYTFSVTVTATAIGTTVAITDWTDNGSVGVQTMPDKTPSGVTLVDLGLPSGTKWASRNIGATSDTDYGYYFAWGETTGYAAATSHSFDWANYKWSAGNKDGSQFSRYVPTTKTSYWGGSGSPDNMLQLYAIDDAAYMAWGGKWRMPTEAECGELLNNTDQEWTTINSVAGRKFMKKSDHSVYIFLPAAGYRLDASFNSQGSRGEYWSSTLNTALPDLARNLDFGSGNAQDGSGSRVYGYTVRAVQSN